MAERTQDYDEERLHQASPLMLGRAAVGREVTAPDREAIYGAYDLEISLAWRKNLSGGKVAVLIRSRARRLRSGPAGTVSAIGAAAASTIFLTTGPTPILRACSGAATRLPSGEAVAAMRRSPGRE